MLIWGPKMGFLFGHYQNFPQKSKIQSFLLFLMPVIKYDFTKI